MGNVFKKVEKINILLYGVQDSGKSTILKKLDEKHITLQIPTIGVTIEKLEYKNFSIRCIDVIDRRIRMLPYMDYLYDNIHCIIYVVDCSNRRSLEFSVESFQRLIGNREMSEYPIVILANKQDVANSLTTKEILREFEIKYITNRKVFIQGFSSLSDEGIHEILEWINQNYDK